MGKKNKRKDRNNFGRPPVQVGYNESEDHERPMGAKEFSKKSKKMKKQKERQVKKDNPNMFAWCRVTVTASSAINKEFLYESLASYIEDFTPYAFMKSPEGSSFYIERKGKGFEFIKAMNNRLQNAQGDTMSFALKYLQYPDTILNVSQLAVLKEVLSKRYNTASALLDLTNLHKDALLRDKDILAPLVALPILERIVNIILESVPNLTALNLSENALTGATLLGMRRIFDKFQIKALCLKDNCINGPSVFKTLNTTDTEELTLSGNKVCSYQKHHVYVQSISTVFPNLKMLDGVSLNPGADTKPIQGVIANPGDILISREMLATFLDQYYKVFDGKDRASVLMNAYTENIKLEFVSKNPNIPSESFLGFEGLKRFLENFPETLHKCQPFVIINQVPTEVAVQVEGTMQIKGFPEHVDFRSKMMLIPVNGGVCCSVHLIEVQ